ncbi:hypothetical protein TEA_006161 [Camellia sinensis var. sinensis]|uniref:Peroxidase n=1 Tax=Camellia sinensis var. sinensis TaxID=542762 RepID=A0A4S4DGI3_CAMSN|nr:hypothetical protein TEA_006161 [Camellia sinensis var. sinensis]
MAFHKVLCSLIVVAFLFSSTLSQAFPGSGWGNGRFFGEGYSGLFPEFYELSCPQANEIVMSVLEEAIAKEPRMAASLLRLHFHDCFVQGCDASILLDDTTKMVSEKRSGPNNNSIRGFEVIDEIKAKLEQACPQTVSCADILALSARGSTILSGGPSWELPLGRRDSRTASLSGSNSNIPAPNSTIQNLVTLFKLQGLNEEDLVALSEVFFFLLMVVMVEQSGGPSWELPLGRRDSRTASLSGSNSNIPAPNSTIQNLVTLFKLQGLNEEDLVALSGGHTIGVARCVTFKQRLYNQNGNNQPDATLEKTYYNGLKTSCPKAGGDSNLSPLDFTSPAKFDNMYFKLLLWGKGLLTSDEVLLTGKVSKTVELVKAYAMDEGLFFRQFARSMVKLGNISPLTASKGEIRKNCRRIN